MTTKIHMHINRVSQPTAARSFKQLSDNGASLKRGQGRSTHYVLPMECNSPA